MRDLQLEEIGIDTSDHGIIDGEDDSVTVGIVGLEPDSEVPEDIDEPEEDDDIDEDEEEDDDDEIAEEEPDAEIDEN